MHRIAVLSQSVKTVGTTYAAIYARMRAKECLHVPAVLPDWK